MTTTKKVLALPLDRADAEGLAVCAAVAAGCGTAVGAGAAVGCGVAMENAPDDLKAAAHCVAPPYDQDGIARFIREHVL